MPMAPEHIEKTSFVCHRGKFELLRMPLGVKNAPAVFQALMTDLLSDCKEYSSPYMDDIVIFGTSTRYMCDRYCRSLGGLG